MEACGTSNYWARQFQTLGFQVKLIPAQQVKPFVANQKNDANDALAICEAAFRPNIHMVPVKTIEQQDVKSLQCPLVYLK
jgi:transposase